MMKNEKIDEVILKLLKQFETMDYEQLKFWVGEINAKKMIFERELEEIIKE